MPAVEVDGVDASAVWEAARAAIERARAGKGPTFLRARCVHLEGHFLGFQLLRMVREPVKELPAIAGPLARSIMRPGGARVRERAEGLKKVLEATLSTRRDPRRDPALDPVGRARAALSSEPVRLRELEDRVGAEIDQMVADVLAEAPA